jgi:hypothetical protein
MAGPAGLAGRTTAGADGCDALVAAPAAFGVVGWAAAGGLLTARGVLAGCFTACAEADEPRFGTGPLWCPGRPWTAGALLGPTALTA